MTATPQSLARALSLRLLVGISLLWLVSAGASLWQAAYEIDETLDSAMIESAQLLMALALDKFDEPDEALEEARELAHAFRFRPHDEYLSFQLRRGDGQLLLSSHLAPSTPLDLPLEPGFAAAGDLWVYTEIAIDGRLVLHMIDRQSHRREALSEVSIVLLLPLLAMLPLAVWIVLATVRRGLVPVAALGRAIGERDGRHLAPLEATLLPSELQPFGHSVNRLLERLNAALQSERQFASTSAHELRTPVAAALAQVQRLAATTVDTATLARAEQIRLTLERLGRLVERLLQLARAEAGIALSTAPVDVMPALHLLLDEFERAEPGRLTGLGLDREELQLPIDVDAFAIVLRNVLDNALRHGGRAGVELLIEADALTVTNGGPVVPADQLARLHERFERASQNRQGFGLGLAIVDTIMRQCGGELQLASPAPGRANGFMARLQFQSAGTSAKST